MIGFPHRWYRGGSIVILSIACALLCAPLGLAWSDEGAALAAGQKATDDAQSVLDDAEAHMDDLTTQYMTLTQEADQLQDRITDTAKQALVAQQAVIEGRSDLSKTAVHEYRDGGLKQSLISLVLDSRSFSDLLKNIVYYEKVADYQSAQVAAQQQRSDQFQSILDDLNKQKDDYDTKTSELDQKKAAAADVVTQASAKLQNAQSDQADRLADLKQKADAMAAKGAVSAPVEVSGATTPHRQEVVPANTPVVPNPDPVTPPSSGGTPAKPEPSPSGGGSSPAPAPTPPAQGQAPSGASWSLGIASAYGGSTDPTTPNPGITASGAVCDDNSMGVAIPMSWPHYWQYYGRTVEISYGGQTVLATINDCGYMGGGSRSLDLQPGVWKSFGFSSCIDWGLRQVNYRIL